MHRRLWSTRGAHRIAGFGALAMVRYYARARNSHLPLQLLYPGTASTATRASNSLLPVELATPPVTMPTVTRASNSLPPLQLHYPGRSPRGTRASRCAPQKTSKWTIVIPTGTFDGFINFEQPASAETYAYAAVSPEVSRAARSTTESSADNGHTGSSTSKRLRSFGKNKRENTLSKKQRGK